MATRTLKIGLSATDKQNMAQDVYDRLIDTVFEDYSSSSTYKVGDYAVYNNVLYRCVTAIVTPEAWNSSKWEVATFQDLVDDVNEAVADVNQFADTKQDTLVSGENIKTINGTSLVGSGDYDFDTALNEASTNAVQNKAITEYITDLESKVSTLAVKVYNHDVALGTLNIENVLYSVANANSFAIPTTIGTNADVVIPKSRMALSAIKGKTEYSRNISLYREDRTSIGLTYGIDITNALKIKGKQNTYGNHFIDGSMDYPVANGNYSISISGKLADKTGEYPVSMSVNAATGVFKGLLGGTDDVRSVANFNIDTGHIVIKLYPTREDTPVDTEYDISVNIMLTKTSDVKPYVPYYTGLKNVELNSLRVYGKTDNYTELRVGDKFSSVLVTDSTAGGLKATEYGNTDLLFTYGNSVQINAGISGLDVYLNGTKITSNTTAVVGDIISYSKLLTCSFSGKIKNATSVKSILPSSILPKTLPAYERIELVANGDDTYKIDLVSHAELHVGDKINSLWVGNPQGENYGSNTVFLNIGEVKIYNPAYDSDVSNRIFTQSVAYISNKNDFYLLWGTALVMGGNDTYVDGNTTNRNITIEFTESLSVTYMPINNKDFTANFRNGEETRTTLIDGLSLDDVSAIIDTGDIVYADNSNAEYDVSIAETFVELLVNKN